MSKKLLLFMLDWLLDKEIVWLFLSSTFLKKFFPYVGIPLLKLPTEPTASLVYFTELTAPFIVLILLEGVIIFLVIIPPDKFPNFL